MDIPTTTRENARERILLARVGSLAGQPTLEYLAELSRLIYEWQEVVDEAIAICTIAND